MRSMKRFVITVLAGCLIGNNLLAQKEQLTHGYPIDPVPFTSVKVSDSFWGQRLKASREVTIPLAFSKCEETGRYRNFELAAHPSDIRLMIPMCIKRSKEPVICYRLILISNWHIIWIVY